MTTARIRVGTSGWAYPHWRGVLYPPGLPQGAWLERYAAEFDTVEINATFYRLPGPEVFAGWAGRTPSGFRFALKGSRQITHRRRLTDCGASIGWFFAPAARLGRRVEVVLWQLPPDLRADTARLDALLDALAGDAVAGRLRHAFEFRERSWFCAPVFDLLAAHGAAVVAADHPFTVLLPPMRAPRGAGLPVVRAPHTADFVYLRRHGPRGRYRGRYTEAMLRAEAARLRRWAGEGRGAYVFYNNDAEGHAVRNARRLQALLAKEAAYRSPDGP